MQLWGYGRVHADTGIVLAEGGGGRPAKRARHLNDLLRLQAPKPDRTRLVFETAIKGQALAADDGIGFKKYQEQLQRKEMDKKPTSATGAAPAGGLGGRAAAKMPDPRRAGVPESKTGEEPKYRKKGGED